MAKSRARLAVVVRDTAGKSVPGASVLATDRVTSNPVNVYNAETGGSIVTQPILTDSAGRVTAWFERGAINLTVSAPGL